MKNITIPIIAVLVVMFSLSFLYTNNGPVISNLTYDNITQTSLTIYWATDSHADSKIRWFASDSNYQPLIFTDSIYSTAMVTNHVIPISNLQPAKIYKYQVISQNSGGITVDSGYFLTQSSSTGKVDVYFNHTVDTTVSTGENAKGSQNFENVYLNRIDSAQHSIDVALWELSDITSVANALISAKNRGVKIRFVYNHTPNTPLMDSLQAHGIPILKRFNDTTYDMHNKFFIFDYRYNSNSNTKFLLTGSTNVTHPQFHSDRNNIIVIQDESLCAVYMREFEEMWGSHTDMPVVSRAKFGPMKINNTPHTLNVAGTRMEVYFSPSDSAASFLSNLIGTKTTKSVFFCMLKFANLSIENSMHSVFNNGNQIKGVFDSSHSRESSSVYKKMKGSGPGAWNPPADVFLDTIPGLLHHKYLIIDANSSAGNKIASTGSYNWEIEASLMNDDNSLTIFSVRVNNLYYQEFYKRYRESGGEIIGIQKIQTEMPLSFSLYQNYPNPFNPVTKIKFSIPPSKGARGMTARLCIYDALGREIAVLVNQQLQPGIYEVEWNASNYPSGVYFYRLETIGFIDTKKMILIK